jgi:hypothetical protein
VTRNSSDFVIVAGLILGATLGVGGTLVSSDAARQMLWLIDGVGVVVATALLAVRFLRRGDDMLAAGFIVFTLGETLLIAGTPAGLDASVPSFDVLSAALLRVSVRGPQLPGVVVTVLRRS